MLIVDAHLDLAYNVGRGRDVRRPAAEQPIADNEVATVGLPDLAAGGVDLICATIFCPPARYGRTGGYTTADEAWAIAQEQIAWYDQQVADGRMERVTTASGLPSPLAAGDSQPATRQQKFILLLEGADAVRKPADVAALYGQGVRIVGLAWRKGRMAGGTNYPGPITAEGRGVVRAMDELRMIHDVSHLAEASFWQLLDLTAGPLIASHSNCRAIVPTDRQLSDDMIKALVRRGGVIGINFYDQFLMSPDVYQKRRCTLADDVLPHIRHICELAGNADHIAIGTDADGGLGRDEMPREIACISDLPRLADTLSAARFSDADVEKIMSGNWLRFFSNHLPR